MDFYCHCALCSKKALSKHPEKRCLSVDGAKLTIPKKGSHVRFDKDNKQPEHV